MQISIGVEHPRDAGYATAMFRALHVAMVADPPPGIGGRTVPSVFTEEFNTATQNLDEARILHPIGSPEADAANAADEVAQAVAAGADPAAALAAVTGKKRGRKSQEQKDAEARAALAQQENALRPGDALRGVDAQTLAQALSNMPLVHASGGVEVRVAPGTPQADIDATKARLDAISAKADSEAAEELAKAAAKITPPPATATAPAIDDDLASLFRRASPAAPAAVAGPGRFAHLSGPALLKEFTAFINAEGGLFWARAVVSKFGHEVLDDMTDDQLRYALENHAEFPKTQA